MVKEIIEKDLITFEYPPDGGVVPIIDPYDGCTIRCPYCFQMDDENWNKDIFVKTNIPQLIKEQLKDWNREKTLYIGSRCDPYLKIEEKYELTRKCLIELNKLNIPVMITTKAHYDIILRDIDIMKEYSSELTVLLGLSNLNQLGDKEKINNNINIANKLYENGINVWAFITPVLPGLTDVDKMIGCLKDDIPVFLDKLRIEKDSVQMSRMLNYIKVNHPQLLHQYEDIMVNKNDSYIEELREKYKDSRRVKFVFE
ncbi:radical SAM protein [uncultured Clostridium sp.]|uniref:radical SAM protein n=1 Tax=uncultured Clostridium sp. TaxID=59620 RepID=UPI0025DA32EF|nr:radical SAM protein [uncultured Clostridium sp.]